MKITKHVDHYLLKNEDGEYHISHEQFDHIGKKAAIRLAESEIKLKKGAEFKGKTINFKLATSLGFCEYGIKDFCKQLELDIESTYTIEELNKKLTLEVLKEYTDECIKLFGVDTLKYLGGVKGVLSEDTLPLILNKYFIPEETLHELGCKFAESVLGNFEVLFPDDKRPRLVIEAKRKWLRKEITNEELKAAESAARSAAWSVVESAARSAVESAVESVAWSVAWSAARSAARSAVESAARSAVESAAWSAAWSVVESAARSAEKLKQVNIILKELNI